MSELAPQPLPSEEDYRKYDRIWRRVSPELNPYPEVRAAQPEMTMEPQLSVLPGAEGESCCMGRAALGSLEPLRGFLREELADAQTYRYLAPLAPTAEGKRLMRQLSAEESGHARTLQSAHFLITGGTYPVTVVLPPQPRLLWRDRLRERFHEEACGAQSYARAAEGTDDVCLRRIFEKLSADEYRHAEAIRRLIEKTLNFM
ncbi:MAG: ferritin-like domain-containing protein [Oscillospiraceae bacterium]|nr:ferritin-like domain-containing protein [Oscillospiraceae bacterium]